MKPYWEERVTKLLEEGLSRGLTLGMIRDVIDYWLEHASMGALSHGKLRKLDKET